MMRTLATLILIAWLLAFAPAVRAARYAILVGIGSYPFLSAPKDQHPGAIEDVKQWETLFIAAGFAADKENGVQKLIGPAATQSAIRNALKNVPTLRAGDVVHFHFSGRGSVAIGLVPGATNTTPLSPTLVPYDAKPGDAKNDITLDELAEWSKKVAAQGALPVITLDTCFNAPVTREIRQNKPYNDQPRCLVRGGIMKGLAWEGEGVFLCAAGSGNAAYEWKVSDRWIGVFTDDLTSLIMADLTKRKIPNFQSLLTTMHGYASDRQYMTRYGFCPTVAPRTDPYTTSVWHMNETEVADVPGRIANARKTIANAVRQREETQRTLLVGVDVEIAEGRTDSLANPAMVATALRTELQKATAGASTAEIRILAENEGRPDRVINLCLPQSGPGKVRVIGTEREVEYAPVTKPCATLSDALTFVTGEASEYLRLQSALKRLYAAADNTSSQSLSAKILTQATPLHVDMVYKYVLTAPSDGLLFVLERHTGSGIIQIVFPDVPYTDRKTAQELQDTLHGNYQTEIPLYHNNALKSGEYRQIPTPMMKLNVSQSMKSGSYKTRLVYISRSGKEGVLPILKPANGNPIFSSREEFQHNLRIQVEAVLSIIKSEPQRLIFHDIEFEVENEKEKNENFADKKLCGDRS